ncbi:helix-turn-helix domain-containing protein [Bradyrhizobium sp. ma5]|uniref:AraC family transcriptional regulator n=1 Tax=Bradyrhizobium sp. ma5 TaxID=3344828 RepID=UPI0035D48014
MADGSTQTFTDPDGYAAAIGDARLNLTMTGAGAFRAEITSLQLQHLKLYRCCESLPRIGYLSLSPKLTFLSFPINAMSATFSGSSVQIGDIIFHGPGERVHQRFNGGCQWGLIALPAQHFADCSEALLGRSFVSPGISKVVRPPRTEKARFQHLFRQACHLAEARRKIAELPEVARALEQDMLHAIVHCLAGGVPGEALKARNHHAAVMVRFEEALSKLADGRPNMSRLCAEVGVAERTLRMCCAEFLGMSPTRYVLLQRLNKARAALQRANPSTTSVAEIARDHQFLELGRFAVTYRVTFGESPSVTLQRDTRT